MKIRSQTRLIKCASVVHGIKEIKKRTIMITEDSERSNGLTIEEPIDGVLYAAACGIKNAAGKSEKPINQEGLEKEMDKFFETMPVLEHENIFEDTFKNIARHFAQWQKEQMLKEAVETVVSLEAGGFPVVEFGVGKFGLKVGDKVRAFIVKEDEK